MATYPNPRRDPLIDSRLQEVLSQRGKELLGLGLISVALVLALVLGSYSPLDPGWMAATDAPVHNALGRLGAALAAPLITITGLGAWGIVLALAVWGLRLVVHQGEQNILGRTVFVPVAVALGSVWLASLVPGAGWTQPFGLGGLFGDTVLAAVMTALPLTTGVANMLTLASFAGALALYLFVLGSSLPEMVRFGRFLLAGLILSYAGLLSLLGLSVRGMGGVAMRGADHWQARRDQRAQARAAAEAARSQHQPWHEPLMQAQPAFGHGAPAQPRYPAMPQSHDGQWAHPANPPRRAPQIHWPEQPVWPEQAAMPEPEPEWQQPDRPQPPRHAPRTEPRIAAPVAPAHAPPAPARGRTAQAAPMQTVPAQPAPMQADPATAWGRPEKSGLLSRVAALGRRPAETHAAPQDETWHDGELIEPQPPQQALNAPAPSPDRIRSRIAELMGGRSPAKPVLRFDPELYPHQRPAAPAPHVEPPLTAQRTQGPASAPAQQPSQPRVQPPSAAQPATSGFAFSHAFGFQASPAPHLPLATPQWHDPDALIEDEDDGFDAAFVDPAPRPPVAQSAVTLNRRVVQTPPRKPAATSRQAMAEAQPRLQFEPARTPVFELPALSLLRDPALERRTAPSHEALEENARMLESVLEDYGVRGEILSVRPGPVVTMYELEPAPGLKASRVIGLSDDIARSMSALSARVSTVPGRTVIGIELPNDDRQTVVLREILASRDFGDSQMRLPLALGKDIGGEPVVANLAKMPHLLIAGTTGSGKSVAINTMILSLLYKLTPQECRLIMIDPKMLELSVYDGIPHLLSPVVTDPKKAVVALKWVVGEMEDRYRKMSKMGVRNIEGYNGRVREALAKGEMFKRTVQTGFDDETGDPVFETEEFAPELLPFIVVIVDEMADLMMVAGKEIEACIQRLAQMARASGIHLIMATQRPSVDVITGTIKANFPTRISFQVTSKIDSRTILGEQGAEQLLGAGDMLYMAGGGKVSRIHGPFVSDGEVEEVVAHLKSFGPADYVASVLEAPEGERESDIDSALGLGEGAGDDALYDQAVAIVARDRKCSTSYIQRKLGIGYNKAARLVEQMEQEGVVSTANHVGKREILVPESH